MVFGFTLPNIVYVYLSYGLPSSLMVIQRVCVSEQFGYGFGLDGLHPIPFILLSGEFRTSHYALASAMMSLSMMVPGLFAGALQEMLGYRHFFIVAVLCCAVTFSRDGLPQDRPRLWQGGRRGSHRRMTRRGLEWDLIV
jgi:PAT family beta-lactamase induction signal transducer AmpG